MAPEGVIGARQALLRELVREGERSLEHQLNALAEQDAKIDRATTIAQAGLAGAVVVTRLLVDRFSLQLGAGPLALLLAGSLVNLAVIGYLLDVHRGGATEPATAQAGPQLAWLADRVRAPAWDLERHLAAVLRGFANYEQANVQHMLGKARKRRWGERGVTASLALYGAALFVGVPWP